MMHANFANKILRIKFAHSIVLNLCPVSRFVGCNVLHASSIRGQGSDVV